MKRVLIADDEEPLLRALGIHLRHHGYEPDLVGTGEEAVTRGLLHSYDLAILDVGLPRMNGVDVVHALRATTELPIIVLSGWHDESWKIRALDAGADDYVTKPFAAGELLARMRAVLRRVDLGQDDSPMVETLDFRIDFAAKRATLTDGTEIALTRTQWQLAELLVRQPDRLVSHEEILRRVWGPEFAGHTSYVRQQMAQLRAKLEPDPARPRYFLTQPGLGVRFVPLLDETADAALIA